MERVWELIDSAIPLETTSIPCCRCRERSADSRIGYKVIYHLCAFCLWDISDKLDKNLTTAQNEKEQRSRKSHKFAIKEGNQRRKHKRSKCPVGFRQRKINWNGPTEIEGKNGA